MNNIRIVWLCSFSNEKIRRHITVKYSFFEKMLSRILGRTLVANDTALWNSNAIEEFEKISNVELHIISPIRNLATLYVEYQENGINYHFFRDENSSLFRKVIRFLFTKHTSLFKINRKRMRVLLDKINPDLVHVIGAENPLYSLGLCEVTKDVPTILQLQALLDRVKNTDDGEKRQEYIYKGRIERSLIKKADFIMTTCEPFINYIRQEIKPDSVILNGTLAMAQKINIEPSEKKYDFVHYAAQLSESKATDVALKAFGEVYTRNPNVTLDLIGSYSPQMKRRFDEIIAHYNMSGAVVFEGLLETHEDVINQIRKSRIALLPIVIDLVPNTLHEAMANGLPLITTETLGTIKLKNEKNCILLSEQGDYIDIANNMLKLLNDSELVQDLIVKAADYEYERNNNRDICLHWVDLYNACIANKRYGEPIPVELLS